jgi:methylated-DNA-protein-cysteine methyltransferase-like protein
MPRRVSHEFQEAVRNVVCEIPSGFVMGYKDVACKIGFPNRARHVGFALSSLTEEDTDIDSENCVPWWRVIRSDGSIARKGSLNRAVIQVAHLKEESTPFRGQKVAIDQCRWLYE